MVSSLRQFAAVTPIMTQCPKKRTLVNTVMVGGMFFSVLSLSACQTAPNTSTATATATATATITTQTIPSSQSPIEPMTTVTQAPIVDDDEDDSYPIEPYIPPEPETSMEPSPQERPVFTPPAPVYTPPDIVIITPPHNDRNDNVVTPKPPSPPSHNDLLEQARRNSQQRAQQSTSSNSTLPAFRNLMEVGVSQLKAGQLTNAESSFTRAQRLAPKSSAVYFYLAQVALKKQQPRKAEAMARRGLTVSRDTNRRRALWQIILRSGQAQGNSRVINEAKQALR